MGYLDLIGEPNAELNCAFLRENPGHVLVLTHEVMHGKSDVFARTCCEITVNAVLWKIGLKIEDCVEYKPASLQDAVNNEKFVIAEVNYGDHWFLIVEGKIMESWWRKYEPRVFECDEAFIREHEKENIMYLIPNKRLF